MARLGKRERASKRMFYEAIRLRNTLTAQHNLTLPKPSVEPISMVAGKGGLFKARPRDETAVLKGNSHTRGISIGQRETHRLKEGSLELASNKRKFR